MPPSLRPPAFVPPPHSCDAHCHIWGPTDRFPFAAARPYTPPERGKEMLFTLHARLGIERAVLVQPIVHGTDNRAMLDAIASDPARYRGVALVAPDISERDLLRLHEGGVRGVRFALVRHLSARPDLHALWRTVEKVQPLGWHALLHVDAGQLPDLHEIVDGLPLPCVIDHMGRVDAGAGLDQPAFAALLALAARDHCWIKLSGADRVSASGPPFRDAVPFARALMAAAPDRVIWGLDFPHPLPRHTEVDDGVLLDLLPSFGDAQALHQLLVGNPERLYGFADRVAE
ncbi:amidohydrolase family protein [Aquabacter sp. CN5-332]|uniref:amidohydrolase family protein n=1 Tax=Aquabacter sp. CN5-332 TaxID=3156608 RepID=UPI0032B4A6E2